MMVKMLCALAGSLAAAALSTVPHAPVNAGPCQRLVSIESQVTAAERSGRLTFTVSTRGCTAPGYVTYVVRDGTARRPADFLGGNGRLQWGSGDATAKHITLTIAVDAAPEPVLEDLTVTLLDPSPQITIESAPGHGRILDGASSATAISDRSCPGITPSGPIPSPEHDPCTTMPDNITEAFAVARGIADGPLSLRAWGISGTLRVGEHFRVIDDVVTWAPGQYYAYVRVEVVTGAIGTFAVQLSAGVDTIANGAVLP